MKKFTIRQLTFAALVGALYVVLSYFGNIFGLTYGPVQFRFAEALTVLPFLSPVTTWGLFIGCVISNILSPYGVLDLIFGSLATLLAGIWTSKCKNKWLAPLPPVICNGVIIGALIGWYEAGFGPGFMAAFALNGASVALGELGVCYVLGMLLLDLLPKTKVLDRLEDR